MSKRPFKLSFVAVSVAVLNPGCLEMPVAERSRTPKASHITIAVLSPPVWASSSFLFSCPEEPQRLPGETVEYSGMMFTS